MPFTCWIQMERPILTTVRLFIKSPMLFNIAVQLLTLGKKVTNVKVNLCTIPFIWCNQKYIEINYSVLKKKVNDVKVNKCRYYRVHMIKSEKLWRIYSVLTRVT